MYTFDRPLVWFCIKIDDSMLAIVCSAPREKVVCSMQPSTEGKVK
jgi:hypothetical protein